MYKYIIQLFVLFSISLFGQSNTFISDVDNLKTAINSALPGDTITVRSGSYDAGTSLTITNSGTLENPILIRAEEIGKVELKGETYFDFRQCEYIILEGFNFTGQDVTAIKLQACNNIRITRNRFALKETSSLKWILVGGVWNDPNAISYHNRIDHNLFENKSFPGNFITIDGTPDPTYISSQYDRIDHNHFKLNQPRAVNEKESIRVGWSELSKTSGFTVVEHNLFEDCDGDPEIISVKTCDDTVRYNTFIRCAGTLSLRHGNRSSVYGNYFLGENKSGTGGIRIYGDDHIIYNNYFEGLTGTTWDAPITLTNGDADSGSLSKHFRINRAIIVHNTLVNNNHNIEIGFTNNGKYSKPPRDLTIADNLIVAKENTIVKIITNPINCSWNNNIFWATENATIGFGIDSSAYWSSDPLLEKNVIFKETINSPSINAGSNSYEFIKYDVEGQLRDSLFDVGADEFSLDSILFRPLTPNDVGPFSETNLTAIDHNPKPINHSFQLFQNFPNPFNPTTTIKYSIPSLPLVNKLNHVTLKIYDVLGREVVTLVNNYQKAGLYEVNWNAGNQSSGIYFMRLKVGREIDIRKITYLK